MEQGPKKLLPENAYRKLEPGEVYEPIVAHDDKRAEVTVWSMALGLVMVALFAAAGIYMALRAGNAIETAIPIAIMAVFFGKMKKMQSTILENVMVQSVGQASGVVAAGAAFVIPALYINQLQPSFWHIFFATTIGGFLGIVLIIPLRKYFVADQHGELPFPEATATNEILISGEPLPAGDKADANKTDEKPAANNAGKVLIISFLLGGLYDFLVEAVHAWNPMMKTSTLLGSVGKRMSDLRFDISLNGLAALFGLGYIIGLRYAAIIASGSVLAYLVLVPLIYLVGSQLPEFHYVGEVYKIAEMSGSQIFGSFVKPIGIGAIAVSGIIGMVRMGKIILGSLSLGLKGLKAKTDTSNQKRTEIDMNPRTTMLIQIGTTLLMGLLFFVVAWQKGDFGVGAAAGYAVLGMVVAFVLSFLFTPVAAQAIAIVGVNPVSGMTLITLVIASAAMAASGLAGPAGMFIALIIGTAVCTALSTSGALVSDFKIGYWIGSTPANQQRWKFAGILVASITVAIVVPAMDSAYHFLVADEFGRMVSNQAVLPAPQANMLAVIVKGLMSDAQQPYLLYGLGGIVAIMLYMTGVPMLAFALGMYLPIFINTPVLFGAFVAYLIGRTGGSKRVREARTSQGILIASGLMAGAAIFGIVTAVLRLDFTGYAIRFLSIGEIFTVERKIVEGAEVTLLQGEAAHWYEGLTGQGLGLATYIVLALLCYLLAKWGAEKELEGMPKEVGDK